MQNPNELMSSTVAAFAQWRATRVHSTQTTPIKLQQQAVALLDHFSSSQVTANLNISGTNIKRWVADNNGQDDFILLPDVVAEPPKTSQLNLELTFGNGCLMRLNGDISPAQLTAITQSVAVQNGMTL